MTGNYNESLYSLCQFLYNRKNEVMNETVLYELI